MTHLTIPVGTRDHIQGDEHASLTLVEYGDYECPYCGEAYPIVKAVQRHFGKKLRLVFRNFPLSQMHPHAELAAEAAESAEAEGKFWAMHDFLYEHQQALRPTDLISYATTIGLDAKRVVNELEQRVHMPRVREDFNSGVRSGVNGTPTFFINGARHDGPWDEQGLIAGLMKHQ